MNILINILKIAFIVDVMMIFIVIFEYIDSDEDIYETGDKKLNE
jgi:hypothetical protein